MDRIGVCEVYYLLEVFYNVGGIVPERPLNARRRAHPESIGVQLSRMGFKPSPLLSINRLDEEQYEYFRTLLSRWGIK